MTAGNRITPIDTHPDASFRGLDPESGEIPARRWFRARVCNSLFFGINKDKQFAILARDAEDAERMMLAATRQTPLDWIAAPGYDGLAIGSKVDYLIWSLANGQYRCCTNHRVTGEQINLGLAETIELAKSLAEEHEISSYTESKP